MFMPPSNRGGRNFFEILDDMFGKGFNSFKINVRETEKEYYIETELPGIKREEIKLDYNNNELRISVIRSGENKNEEKNYFFHEKKMDKMQRSIYLNNVKKELIAAKFEDGILKIIAPKDASIDSVKRIEIR